ncbi:unnamed protein product [Brassica napus]|nr:unnamed protein product [Brassica napus]
MAEEYKNASEEFKNVPEHESTPKVATTEEPSATTGEVKDRGLFDFLGKKEEVKPQETTTLESEFEHKAQVSEPPAFVAKHEEEEERDKPTLLEKLHHKHEEEEEENKPSLLQKLHRSNSSSSSSDEEGEDGEKRKKEKKKIAEEDEKTKEDRKGVMEQIREKFPHGTKTEDDTPVIATLPVKEETVEHPEEKKRLMEKIKEKLPGHSEKPEDSQVVDTAAAVPVTEKKRRSIRKRRKD